MITAKEAKEMVESSQPHKDMEEIYNLIRKHAAIGEYKAITRDYGFGSGSCYTKEDKYPERCKLIIKELRAKGYKCSVKCKEMQFVDMWLEIDWS